MQHSSHASTFDCELRHREAQTIQRYFLSFLASFSFSEPPDLSSEIEESKQLPPFSCQKKQFLQRLYGCTICGQIRSGTTDLPFWVGCQNLHSSWTPSFFLCDFSSIFLFSRPLCNVCTPKLTCFDSDLRRLQLKFVVEWRSPGCASLELASLICEVLPCIFSPRWHYRPPLRSLARSSLKV